MKRIYLDYASITPIDRRVQREIDAWGREPLNPSSIHSLGVTAKKAVDAARKDTADFLRAHSDEIVFTSGGTEANGLVLEGAGRAAFRGGLAKRAGAEKIHLIVSSIEHSSVIETANMMERHGVEVTRLPVDGNGLVSAADLKKAIRPNTYLVSVMAVNNETGAIQPIREIAKVIRDARKRFGGEAGAGPAIYPLLHTDACQATLLDLNVEKLGVDFLTLDASKAYGPRGVGALYVRRGSLIEQIVYGGGQEGGLRSGTENVPGVRGFALALKLVAKDGEEEAARLSALKKYFFDEVKKVRPDVVVNGDLESSAPHILSVSVPGVDAEMLVLRLDAFGVSCSTKSACLRDEDESYVLRAMGRDSKSSIRFSFGRWTKKGEAKKVVGYLRKLLV